MGYVSTLKSVVVAVDGGGGLRGWVVVVAGGVPGVELGGGGSHALSLFSENFEREWKKKGKRGSLFVT
ncbi:hypothetical protein RHMOL_Rhmol08G0275900 [Rhododendron molle]|uniref:Uncharacterized protein n=1 Tax=Rhododendron molle TaxID=49168 RepID=A0ACC0MUM1_RHOML|nr:hypothetical protein RHMOL_Rhmol08G0275900 [Rhododendron molle]